MHPPEPQNQKLQSSTLPGAKPCAASCSHTASNALLARTGAFTSPVHASKQLSSSFHLPKSAALHMMHFVSLFYNRLLRIHLAWMPKSQTETQQLCSKVPWPPWGRVAWTGPCPPQGSPRLGAFPGPLGGGLGLVGMSGGRHEGTPGAWLPLELQGDNAAKSHGKWLQELDPTGSQPCRGSLD